MCHALKKGYSDQGHGHKWGFNLSNICVMYKQTMVIKSALKLYCKEEFKHILQNCLQA